MSLFYPIELFADWVTYRLLSLTPDTMLAGAVHFFIYDTIKIFLLLTVVIFAVSIIRSFLPAERVRYFLSRRHPWVANLLAAMLGIITPFCSCSAVPLFIGFVSVGVPLGATFSFLVASPMINEVALVMLLGLFGLKVALIYIASGLLIAVVAGIVIGRLKAESLVESFVFERMDQEEAVTISPTWSERGRVAASYTRDIVKRVWPYVVIGIGIGAWMHGYVPSDLLAKYTGSDSWYAVPLATAIGVPLYSNVAGIIPLVSVLTEKGVSIGTSLAFMMAVTALSMPEFMILKRIMRTRLILIFAAVVACGIMLIGYLFNAIL